MRSESSRGWIAERLSRLRDRFREFGWVYKYRRIRFTREGWFFFTVTMAIGFAALNTGHNLFYLVFALLVSMIIVSGILSERAVKGLRVRRKLPREIFARSTTAVTVEVENRSRRTSYVVEIHDAQDEEARKRVGFVERLRGGESRSFPAVWTFGRRGRHLLRNVHLVTRFPFGLFEKTRIVPLREEVLVFPAIERGGGRRTAVDLTRAALRKHRLGEELLGLRPKLPEDDRRRIHWRVSARAGELMVMEPGEAPDRAVAIFFDSRGPAGEGFERAIEHAASLLWEAYRDGRPASFHSWTVHWPAAGRDALLAALGWLATVAPEPASSSDRFGAWSSETARRGGGVFVTAGEPPALPQGALLRVA